ncbi:PREDICTED: uncharacterized protein C1orf131 [Ceratosolen solmsi marchali]|uniref:Uncharacterized protein C1orf131 n=1 Tax=Ceratosolen solmsi marchali TaxID=326594 RepID=A0AAJ6YME9_9HYME|nr:PREDICTED: uncharacterized protein C1orf131 [Ceratosolen solmsi marchali]
MEDFIKTRASNNIENAEKMHTLFTYEAHKPSSLTKDQTKSKNALINRTQQSLSGEKDMKSQKINEKEEQEKEMKRFRYDIIKFGMSGLDKHSGLKAKMALAISLGAKPPKNRGKNYKKLIEERKRNAAQEAKKLKFASGFSASKLLMNKNKKNINSNTNKRKGKKSNGILDVYGKVAKGKAHKKGSKKN